MVVHGVERNFPRKHLGPEALAVTRSPPKSKLSNFTVTFMAHGVSSLPRGALKQSGNGHGAQAYPRSEERPPGKATAPNSDLTGPSSSAPRRRRQVDLSQNGYSLSLSLSLSLYQVPSRGAREASCPKTPRVRAHRQSLIVSRLFLSPRMRTFSVVEAAPD